MNRHDRRAAAARAKGARAKHNNLYEQYIRHLPKVPGDAPAEPGRVYHLVIHHDERCRFYENENILECNL
jgi:hypothetical protein